MGVLTSFVSTWHKLESSGRKEPGLRISPRKVHPNETEKARYIYVGGQSCLKLGPTVYAGAGPLRETA